MATKTPTLEYMLKIQEQSSICGEFLEWLQKKYAMFRLDESRDEAFYHGTGDYINIEKVLAEFFDVDLEQAEEEKQSLLNSLTAKNATQNKQPGNTKTENIKIESCDKQNCCVDCTDPNCRHAGEIYADCPKYHCDNENTHDCKNCDFIKKHIASMRAMYKSQNKKG